LHVAAIGDISGTSYAGLSERGGALARFGCHGVRGVRACNGDLGAEPPAGVQGAELKMREWKMHEWKKQE